MTRNSAALKIGWIAALIVVSAGVTLAVLMPAHERPDGVEAGTPRQLVRQTIPPGSKSVPASPSNPVARSDLSRTGGAMDTREQDQRQIIKITRGLTINHGGGVLVESTPPGSVAGLLGVKPGDVIVSMNGTSIESLEDFARVYREQGMPTQMTIVHKGREVHRH
jgi:S1-C subfamily serine protease